MSTGHFTTPSVSREISNPTNPTSSECELLRLIGENKRVLELGCGAGHMSQSIRNRSCEVVGIETDLEAGQKAAAFCQRVILADLDNIDLDAELGADRFDVVVAADILGRLKNPARVLDGVKKFIRPNGYVVVSVPNVAHLSVRLSLLCGKFPYGESGLLDPTHLRFFTSASAQKLLEDAGLMIGHFGRVQSMPADPAQFEAPYGLQSIPRELIDAILRDPDAWTHQFILVGHPLVHPGLTFIQERMKQLANQAESAHRDVANLTTQIESLSERAVAAESGKLEVEFHLNRLRQEAFSLRERNDQLQQSNVEAERQIELSRQEDGRKQTHIEELLQANKANQLEAADLRKLLEQQNDRIAGLTVQVGTLLSREKELREMLLEAHDELLRRDDEIAAALPTMLSRESAPASVPAPTAAAAVGPFAPQTLPGKYLQYQQMLQRIRECLRDAGLHGEKAAVISKGDEALVKLEPWCTAWHFPQGPGGVYAGYHPESGAAAIKHLQELRDQGAEFLLIPHTSLWWLDYYVEFRDYLNQHFFRTIDQPGVCILFDLSGSKETRLRRPSSAALADNTALMTPVSSYAIESRPFGVNVCGHLASEKGLGAAVRGQIRSFVNVNVPLALNNYQDNHAANQDNEFTEFTDENPYGVNLIHLNADTLKDLVDYVKPREYFQNHYNIGYWAWETPVFPEEWWDRFQFLDEIWVGSDFVMDAVSRVSPIPVVKARLSIPDLLSTATLPRSHFDLPSSSFVFLFVFDFMSVTHRKNPFGLIQAFRRAFTDQDNALLVLKCAHSEGYADDLKELEAACEGANVRIINAVYSRKEMISLMKAADCYVSLHRSEGFGLTMAEAMSLGKPVIATAFSGNMEFMTPANSYLVKYSLTKIEQEYGPYREGFWADPDPDHAAELMQHVFRNRKEARRVGRRGRADILKDFNEHAVGALMRDRLHRLAGMGKIASPPVDARAEAPEPGNDGVYGQVVSRIRQIVEATVPQGSRLLVVSKGDEELVDFDECSASHFPQAADGTYSGHHPSNGKEAVEQLEALRNQGNQYLLLPQTGFWWLEYYTELQAYLQSRCRQIWNDKDCVIYQLFENRTGRLGRFHEKVITALRPGRPLRAKEERVGP
jgi:glycosyltransferase involved in cell wall biosynthesis/2-polyprenyl-3-methyl-5-hydroxy-6-metoxy-1,4-benzoquinol methylase